MQVLHADAHLLVVGKPAGLLSVPGRLPENQDCVTTRLQMQYADALNVHRLDQVTSGLMVFARSKAVQAALSAQFASRLVEKTYIALVEGILLADAGEVALPLRCDWPKRPRQMVCHAQGKPAFTAYHVLQRDTQRNTTRVQLQPTTGRSHQLRVHMASLGHPIAGDRFYGAQQLSPAHDNQGMPRVCLHAAQLAFTHPVSGAALRFTSAADF